MFVTSSEIAPFFPSLSTDPTIATLIAWASDAIEKECDRVLKQRAVTEIYYSRPIKARSALACNWPSQILLKEYPVADVVIRVGETIVSAADYRVTPETGKISWVNAQPSSDSIRIDYNGGYNPLPSNLKLACISAVGAIHHALKSQLNQLERANAGSTGQIKKFKIENFEEEYFEVDGSDPIKLVISPLALALIDTYRRADRAERD